VLRFRFDLTPTAEIPPWPGVGDTGPSLSWFGLTDGCYWIEAGGQELLRYNDQALAEWAAEGYPAVCPYVDYQVVRLWEDLMEIVPRVLEPVPADLVDIITNRPAPGRLDRDETSDEAATWRDGHILFSWHLTAAPQICFYRTSLDRADVVTVAWHNDPHFTGPEHGQVQVPTPAFIDAVRAFDRELLDAMEHRVAELERTGSPDGVHIDMRQLRAEQQDRGIWMPQALQRHPDTDWAAIRAGARKLREA
jgi:hypothetical protein